ncbi:MAG: cobalamin-binding protein [Euryarchaeota archaeon]|nr:cobalamin-binding protein [Euryarchaeota archaeon]
MVIAIVASSVVGFSAGYVLGGAQKKVTLSIVDDYGRTVELHGIPQRIVSVAPSPTEILFAVGAGSQVVGVDNYSDYPAEAKSLPQIGSYTLNMEVIMSLKPDLIVSSDLVPRAQLDQLEAQGVPYFIFATRTMEDVIKDLRLAGSLTGHSLEAESLVAGLQARINAVTNKTLAAGVEKVRTYIEYYPLWTYGPGSFGNDLIRLAGGINIAANASNEYPELTPEFIIAQNPQVIVYTVGPMTTTTASDFATRSGWSITFAVSHDKIYSIDDNLVSRYGPRVVDGLEQLAEIIHPELFT